MIHKTLIEFKLNNLLLNKWTKTSLNNTNETNQQINKILQIQLKILTCVKIWHWKNINNNIVITQDKNI